MPKRIPKKKSKRAQKGSIRKSAKVIKKEGTSKTKNEEERFESDTDEEVVF